ncbi:hypothetical protein A2303_01325 [Candidatus Falkowbacteria bacterium RIFOXYB2_FULL_47_14]|uniref:DUF3795 domain-containing protein n=1 Tax=Candidatus Falkowbacteria bacterium RIFOXYA2_FULL_47_19 TaxID=1797994 RepID=A0A1F5SH52_9BACT|nr:MAG: hypothetical protein A2227_05620 [Candidatus Falkowbacteria bacterium RIFOXYA2_FULL_47_19]OGF34493.1 MAG: hypothetical protein A2468_04665 [Candidatus Falkowbacteria bacterium RIFOXYC2_FULL_46_15]OGF43532.1 MAG: hypothetical protein A2303_01325 [Candidatus Falkowbacteria bacterium RIFOXYB2_FULL_47_14]
MLEVKNDPSLVAFCGLYCGACKKYLTEKCPGCVKNEKASWCQVRVCCLEHGYKSCAECKEFDNVFDCAKFNNFFSKLFGFIFRSDRGACIARIKEIGLEAFAREMAEKKMQTIKK